MREHLRQGSQLRASTGLATLIAGSLALGAVSLGANEGPPSRRQLLERLASLGLQSGEGWALIVGTDDEIASASEHAATSLLRTIGAVLRSRYGYREESVTGLYNEEATADAIRQRVYEVLSHIETSDSLVVLLSLPVVTELDEPFFVPHGGLHDEPWTLLTVFELGRMLSQLPSRRTLLIFPSCGEMAAAGADLLQHYAYQREGPQIVELLAYCGPNAGAARVDFANAFLDSLQGAGDLDSDGVVTSSEITLFLQKRGYEEGSFRVRSERYPEYTRDEFAFRRYEGRLTPYLARLGDEDPRIRGSAIDGLERTVLAEPADHREDLLREAGEALVPIAQEESGNDRYRAIAALAAIGYRPAVPVLGELLKHSDDAALRQSAVEGLAQFGGDESVPHLRRAVTDPAAVVRLAAIRALRSRQDPSCFEKFLRLAAEDPVEDVRLTAWQVASTFEGRETALRGAALLLLGDPSPALRREAASTLGALGGSLVTERLIELLGRDPDASVRRAAAYSLGRAIDGGDRAAAQRPLTAAARDPDDGARQAAAWALGEIGAPDTDLTLRQLLRDASVEVRRSAAEALGKQLSVRSVPELIRATKDPAPEVRQAAVGALGRIGLPKATDALLVALNDRNAAVQWEAERALERLKGIPTAELIAGLESTSPRTRAEAARKLGDSGNPRLVPRLLPLLGDEDFGVRQAAIAALARFRDDTSSAQLLGALSDANPVVRAGVVAVLGMQGRTESLPDLVALADDPDPTLRAEVIRSLATIDPQATSSTIMAASSDPNAEVRIAVADALGVMASPEAREALQMLARDESPQVRLRAITILGYSMRK